ISPALGEYRPTMQRPSVDLPQPDSPTRPSASPRAISRSTAATAPRPSAGIRRVRRTSESARTKFMCTPRTSSRGASDTGDHRVRGHVLGAVAVVDAGRRPAGPEPPQREVALEAVLAGEPAA